MKSEKPYLLNTQDSDYKALTKVYPNLTKIIHFKSGDLESSFEKDLGNWIESHMENGKLPLEIKRFTSFSGKFAIKTTFSLDDAPKLKSVTFAFTESSYSRIEDIVNKYLL